jgi:4-diphosphocytidyl-2-C-methyl-D-erythritol kinase
MLIRNLSSNQVRISAPAKLNLYLELLGKRADGFHELETVMTTVSLFDQLSFTANESGHLSLSLEMAENHLPLPTHSLSAPIPTDARNLILQALILLQKTSSTSGSAAPLGMDVQMIKRIPSSAGLGGASSNAAAAMIAANALWNLELSRQQLFDAAAEIGSDVPFFLEGGMAICRGRGEKIEAIQAPSALSFVIAKPPAGLSTPSVFGQCKLPATPCPSAPVIAGVQSGRPDRVAGSMFNRLQPAAECLLDEIEKLEAAFSQLPCLGHQMSGSGSSYFGLFRNARCARAAAARLSARWPSLKIHCVTSLARSAELTA